MLALGPYSRAVSCCNEADPTPVIVTLPPAVCNVPGKLGATDQPNIVSPNTVVHAV